ncbi:MAG: aminotransferase class V-fold PLP-dependent enzyme, partial [Clostridia bacterium]|nr:aminotransferase class V-fold PLP-dependent enzyme [Clostridia bacterium]
MIYLDNAATSFPKPWRVTEEQARCMKFYCGNPGRGSHTLAMRAAEKIYECREEAATLFGSPHPENLIFTMNTTLALNTAIKGLLHDGDHVLISDMEHNAVFRPIYKLARERRITYDIFPTYPTAPTRSATQICEGISKRIRPNTRMLICAHASNICSAVLPLEEIGALCRRKKILFVVDAAQSAGHLSIDMERMQIDALCVPGHKGLLGPQGTGILLLGNGIVADTLAEGGSGFNSLDGNMPEEAP